VVKAHVFIVADLPELEAARQDARGNHLGFLDGIGRIQNDFNQFLFRRFNTFGDNNFLLLGEQRYPAHLTQIHAHGIIGAIEGALGRQTAKAHFLRQFFLVQFFLGFEAVPFKVIHDFNVRVAQGDHHIVYLLGACILGQEFIQLVIGDFFAGTGALDRFLRFWCGKNFFCSLLFHVSRTPFTSIAWLFADRFKRVPCVQTSDASSRINSGDSIRFFNSRIWSKSSAERTRSWSCCARRSC